MYRSSLNCVRSIPRSVIPLTRSASSSSSSSSTSSKGYTPLAIIGLTGTAVLYHSNVQDLRSTEVYSTLINKIFLPLLRTMDPEQAHNLSIRFAAHNLTTVDHEVNSDSRTNRLAVTAFGLRFRNPVGLAAGFDKQAEAMDGMLNTGFGFVEVGTVTPLPQPGNPKPRMFRLTEDKAVINRFGFNSDGLEVIQERLAQYWAKKLALWGNEGTPGGNAHATLPNSSSSLTPNRAVVGINIGKNKEGDAQQDYTTGMIALSPLADYVTVNISSPNTPGLRSLQSKDQLYKLLFAIKQSRDNLPWGIGYPKIENPSISSMLRAKFLMSRKIPTPILVKIAPDLTDDELQDIAKTVLQVGIEGIIVSNTTIERPNTLKSSAELVSQTGGLSGAPVKDRSTAVLRRMYELTNGKVTLIGVGGISNAKDAYQKIRSGATLVQVYTALAYEGPTLPKEISKGLLELLKEDGYYRIEEAIGADVKEKITKESKTSGWFSPR